MNEETNTEPTAATPFSPAMLVRARALLQAIEVARNAFDNLLTGYFYGVGRDPETEHIKYDLQAGTYTLLDGAPEGN